MSKTEARRVSDPRSVVLSPPGRLGIPRVVYWTLAAAVIVVATAVAVSSLGTVRLDATDSGRQITVRVGRDVEVFMVGHATPKGIGIALSEDEDWRLAACPANLVFDEMEDRGSSRSHDGRWTNQEVWRFKAVKPGQGDLVLEYVKVTSGSVQETWRVTVQAR